MNTGKLTTHVLDLKTGFPATGLKIDLMRDGTLVKSVSTNDDGRVDSPLLMPEDMATGVYELVFHAGDYLKQQGVEQTEPFFLDLIPIRFGINDVDRHYHVPLLLSPYGYSTYRGS